MLVGLKRRHRHRVMQVLRRSDEDDVNVRVGEHLAIIDIGLRGGLFFRLDDVLALGQVTLIRIAHRDDVDQVLAGEVHLLHHVLAAGAGGDPANAQSIILAKNRQNTGSGNHGRGGGFLQDLPAGNVFHSGQVSSESGSLSG